MVRPLVPVSHSMLNNGMNKSSHQDECKLLETADELTSTTASTFLSKHFLELNKKIMQEMYTTIHVGNAYFLRL